MNDRELSELAHLAVLGGSFFDATSFVLSLDPRGLIEKVDLDKARNLIIGANQPENTTSAGSVSDDQYRKNIRMAIY